MAIKRTLGVQTIDCGKCGDSHEVAIFQRDDHSAYYRCPKEDGAMVEVPSELLTSMCIYRTVWERFERLEIAADLKRERAALKSA